MYINVKFAILLIRLIKDLYEVSTAIESESLVYPAGDNGVHVFGVAVAEGHEVSIKCANALQAQADEAGGCELQQLRGQVISTWPAVYQRRVDLSRTRNRAVTTQHTNPASTEIRPVWA